MGDSQQKKYAWMAFSAICIMIVVWTGIQWSCMNLYAAPVVEELGISRTQFMFSLSIPSVISAAVSLSVYGIIESRVGMRRMLLIGGILNTLAFVCWIFMHSLVLLYIGSTLYGFGASLTAYCSVNAGVNRWFKQRMGSLVGVINAMGNVGGIVFALVIAALIASIGWRFSFLVCGIVSAVATVACFFLYKGNPEDVGVKPMYSDETDTTEESAEGDGSSASVDGDGISFKASLRTARLWILALGFFLLGMTTYALMSTMPLFALDLGFANAQGQAVSASLFASAIMLIPLGMICDRFGARWGLAICCVFTIIAAALINTAHLPFAGLMVAAVFAGAGYSACSTAVGVGLKETFGDRDFSKKLGLCSGCMYVGLAMGPTSTNFIYDTSGTYHMALLAIMVLAVVMAVIFMTNLRRAY